MKRWIYCTCTAASLVAALTWTVHLATKALSFEFDKKTGKITKAPLIAINDLVTESERNEQDGIRYMLMGFFQGPRNLYQHRHIGAGVDNTLSVIIEASFFLRLLDGHSITKNGRWIPSKVSYREIYNSMPKRIDRWRLIRLLKKREHLFRKQKNPEHLSSGHTDQKQE